MDEVKGVWEKKMKINLGCGLTKLDGYLNIDENKNVKPDKVMDIDKVPWPIENESVDEILCDNVIEHLRLHFPYFFSECYRILKPNGKIHLITTNNFRVSNRIRFLFGEFGQSQGWHIWHTKLIKPSVIKEIAKQQGFDVMAWKPNNLFDAEINVILRKRP